MIVRSRRLIALAAVVPLLIAVVNAEPLTSIPNPRNRNGTWVTDMPGILRADTIARLNSSISEFERTSGAEMAVVVIKSLDGLSIEEATVKLFELWKIGKKGSDNGLLLLWSTGDRRVRLEVGYGLEGVLPDGKVGAILDTYVLPKFRSGQFDEGLLAGVDEILRAARKEPVALSSQRSEPYGSRSHAPMRDVGGIIIGLLAGIPISVGSFFGLRKWRRNRRRRCPVCQTMMTRLGEAEEDALLEAGQQAEKRIGSVAYDVWKCGSCGHHVTQRYPKRFSGYAECPQCRNRTKSSTETVIFPATTIGDGSAQVVETCACCAFRREYTKALPRIQPIDSSSSGSSDGGSSSFSGGSDAGSSSFGGGDSGGGGASGGY
jgi:uncharacterized protein